MGIDGEIQSGRALWPLRADRGTMRGGPTVQREWIAGRASLCEDAFRGQSKPPTSRFMLQSRSQATGFVEPGHPTDVAHTQENFMNVAICFNALAGPG